MRIGIHAAEGHKFPNLALMRISAWHKAQGDTVEWYMPLARYDRVYSSKIFTFTAEDPYLPPDTIRGGTGYDVESRLPPEIEAMPPDYTIYPQFEQAYGFLTRGCVNRCKWCVVPQKEGELKIVADIEEVCRTNTGFRKRAILMDNNFLAAPIEFVREQTEKMRRLGVRVDFNQGTDARLYDEERAEIMARVPWLSSGVRMACDTDAMIPHCIRAMRLLRKFGFKKDFRIYVLARAEEIESAIHRIGALTAADKRANPFVMPYRDLANGRDEVPEELRHLANWCNRVWIRKSCKFSDYQTNRRPREA